MSAPAQPAPEGGPERPRRESAGTGPSRLPPCEGSPGPGLRPKRRAAAGRPPASDSRVVSSPAGARAMSASRAGNSLPPGPMTSHSSASLADSPRVTTSRKCTSTSLDMPGTGPAGPTRTRPVSPSPWAPSDTPASNPPRATSASWATAAGKLRSTSTSSAANIPLIAPGKVNPAPGTKVPSALQPAGGLGTRSPRRAR
jgi:hypothetical protein